MSICCKIGVDERKIERARVRGKERQTERESNRERERDMNFELFNTEIGTVIYFTLTVRTGTVDSIFLIKYPSIHLEVNKVVIRQQIKSDCSLLFT